MDPWRPQECLHDCIVSIDMVSFPGTIAPDLFCIMSYWIFLSA